MHCDPVARIAYINGTDCGLKPKEFELLQFLLRNQNVALTRDQILSGVWGDDYFGSDRTVDMHVSNLRKKLGDYGRWIKTLSGHGYRFEVQE
jgi:DNA-binding response OmpR family regulator